MTTTTAPALAPASSIRITTAVALALLAGFGGYTLWVIAHGGLLGFLTLAGREPWAMQLLLDLLLACGFGLAWLRGDARRRGIASWPFLVATVLAGSIGLLAYAALRGVLTPRPETE